MTSMAVDFRISNPERMAQATLYEWDHDNNFNGIMNSSANRVDMNILDSWQHDQYGLRYKVSPYAKERIKEPFKRIENQDPD